MTREEFIEQLVEAHGVAPRFETKGKRDMRSYVANARRVAQKNPGISGSQLVGKTLARQSEALARLQRKKGPGSQRRKKYSDFIRKRTVVPEKLKKVWARNEDMTMTRADLIEALVEVAKENRYTPYEKKMGRRLAMAGGAAGVARAAIHQLAAGAGGGLSGDERRGMGVRHLIQAGVLSAGAGLGTAEMYRRQRMRVTRAASRSVGTK